MADNHTVVCHFLFKKLYKKMPLTFCEGHFLFFPHHGKMWDNQKYRLKKSIGSSKIVVEETNNEGEKPMLYFDDIKVEFES